MTHDRKELEPPAGVDGKKKKLSLRPCNETLLTGAVMELPEKTSISANCWNLDTC